MLAFTADHEVWLAGEQYLPGEHQIGSPSAELVLHAGSAHAAGEIVVTAGLDDTHVQSQFDAEAAQAAAQGDWVPGTFVAAVIELDENGDPVLDEDGQKIVLAPAYTSAGRWSGGWSDGNELQYRLEQARKSGDLEELARVEADIAALGEGS